MFTLPIYISNNEDHHIILPKHCLEQSYHTSIPMVYKLTYNDKYQYAIAKEFRDDIDVCISSFPTAVSLIAIDHQIIKLERMFVPYIEQVDVVCDIELLSLVSSYHIIKNELYKRTLLVRHSYIKITHCDIIYIIYISYMDPCDVCMVYDGGYFGINIHCFDNNYFCTHIADDNNSNNNTKINNDELSDREIIDIDDEIIDVDDEIIDIDDEITDIDDEIIEDDAIANDYNTILSTQVGIQQYTNANCFVDQYVDKEYIDDLVDKEYVDDLVDQYIDKEYVNKDIDKEYVNQYIVKEYADKDIDKEYVDQSDSDQNKIEYTINFSKNLTQITPIVTPCNGIKLNIDGLEYEGLRQFISGYYDIYR